MIMALDLVIIGAGGFGRETLDVVDAWNKSASSEPYNVLGVVDDSPAKVNLERLALRGYRYLGDLNSVADKKDSFQYLIGIGSPSVRAKISERCDAYGWTAATVVHPSASIGSATRIGAGTIVCSGVQVSSNVDLGRHVNLNPGAIVGHDSILENFVSVNPGGIVSGDVVVEACALIGAGAVVLQGLRIGAWATVGASACVTKNVGTKTVNVGVPASVLQQASAT